MTPGRLTGRGAINGCINSLVVAARACRPVRVMDPARCLEQVAIVCGSKTPASLGRSPRPLRHQLHVSRGRGLGPLLPAPTGGGDPAPGAGAGAPPPPLGLGPRCPSAGAPLCLCTRSIPSSRPLAGAMPPEENRGAGGGEGAGAVSGGGGGGTRGAALGLPLARHGMWAPSPAPAPQRPAPRRSPAMIFVNFPRRRASNSGYPGVAASASAVIGHLRPHRARTSAGTHAHISKRPPTARQGGAG
jgi:hypothetical protein